MKFLDRFKLYGRRNIAYGEHLNLSQGCKLHAKTGLISIGDNVSMNYGVIVDAEDGGVITIGDDCLIGPYVVIRAANHRYEKRDVPIRLQGHKAGTIILESNVWVGANCVITAGVCIGKGSIIGAGTVVRTMIPPFSVVCGERTVKRL